MERETRDPDSKKWSSRRRTEERGERAKGSHARAGSEPIGALHRSAGNQAVKDLHERGELQAKLAVSDPNDAAEREAERVAADVLDQPEPEGTGTSLSRQTAGSGTTAVDAGTEAEIESVTGGGSPLSQSTKEFFEPRFGHDFSDIRVHTGPEADKAARSIDAAAFTVGRDVVFKSGRFRPERPEGKHLLAHELTHVAQQSAAVAKPDQFGSASDGQTIHRQPEGGSSVPSYEELQQRDSLPLDRYLTPKGLKNASMNLVAFGRGLVAGTSLSWSQILSILQKSTGFEVYSYLPAYLTGIGRGVTGAAGEYADMIRNVDEVVATIVDFAAFLVFEAEPDAMRSLGTEVAASISGQLESFASLEGADFYERMGEMAGSILLEAALSAVAAGVIGKTSKVAQKLADLIPERLRKRADDAVELPDRKKPPDAERPEWHSETDEITYTDDKGRKMSPVEKQKRNVDVERIKGIVIDRWRNAIENDTDRRPVKVVSKERGEFSATGGYVTELRHVKGASPRRMEEILGLEPGELTTDGNGAIVHIFDEVPDPADMELKGTTLFPEGESMSRAQLPYRKGDGVPQWVVKTDLRVGDHVEVAPDEAF